MPDDLDLLVRRVDEDRWLASRFASAPARARLIALYAVNYEIARTGEVVSQASLGDMRLEWWRAGLQQIADGAAPRAHPALAALEAARASPTAIAALQAMVEARARDLDPEPFANWDELDIYLDATAGQLMALAIEACEPAALAGSRGFVTYAGRAWGYAGLLRAEGIWRASGRWLLPRAGGHETEVLARARSHYAKAQALAREVAPAAFAGVGYVALLGAYLDALDRGERVVSLLSRQFRLVFAAATGRL